MKHWIERLTEFADKNPFCFIVGLVTIFNLIQLVLNFFLSLFGRIFLSCGKEEQPLSLVFNIKDDDDDEEDDDD